MEEFDDKEKELILAVKTAREHGDLKENAEYHAAREALALYRSRKQAEKEAKEAREAAKREMSEEKQAAIQQLLDQGMSMDDIAATMPWMLE